MSDKKCDLQQLYKLVQDSLSDDRVKARCVLGRYQSVLKDYDDFENCCELKLPLIEWMGNLMTLAGAFLYAKFNLWRTGTGAHPTDKERPNVLYLKRLLVGIQNTNIYFKQASSGLRILRVLDGLYDNFDMNFLVIKYLITNLQIEMGFNFQGKGGLSKLIGFPDEKSLRIICSSDEFEKDGQNLAAAFNYVSVCRSDPALESNLDLDKYKIDEVWCAFEDVFKTMEFMKRVKLNIDSDGNVNFIETTSNGEEKYIPSHGIVKMFEKTKNGKYTVYKSGMDIPKNFKVDFYLLEKIEYLSDITTINAAVRLLYQSFDESNSLSVYFSEKEGLELKDCDFPVSREKSAADYFKRVSGYLPGRQSTAPFFRGMITTHYRYFNILAPSIVDAIDTDLDAKTRILRKFVKEEEALFKEALKPAFEILESASVAVFPNNWKEKIEELCKYISKDIHHKDNECHYRTVVDWDALILRILIYEGPSEILKTVLLCDKQREYNTNNMKIVEDTCKKIIAGLEMRYIDNIFEASDVANKQKEHYEKINQKLENLKDYHPENYFFKVKCKALAQSYIDTIISELTRINKVNVEIAKDKFAENSIQDTLEILEAYKKENEYSKAYKVFLETIKAFLSFYAGILESCPYRMSYEFERSASILSPEEIDDKQSDIENIFLKSVGKKISELSKFFNDAANETDAVKRALEKLWKFANDMTSEEAKYYKAVLGRTPINTENLAKIFKNVNKIIFIYNGEDVNFETAKERGIIIECLDNVIRFLAGLGVVRDVLNKSKENYMDYEEYVKRVVYPQVVTFAKQHEDSDANNCLIMNHSGAFADWHKGGVKILTEFKYKRNHSYYVLPNLNRIATEWWVDPILVSCYKFDDEMRKASADKENMRWI
jgi:hypothetical protein